MNDTRQLTLLEWAPDSASNTIANLPSWVPDFTRPARSVLTWDSTVPCSFYDAAKPQVLSSLSFQNSVLYLKPTRLQYVEDVSRRSTEATGVEVVDDCARIVVDNEPTFGLETQSPLELFGRLLIADRMGPSSPAQTHVKYLVCYWMEMYLLQELKDPDVVAEIGLLEPLILVKLESLPSIRRLLDYAPEDSNTRLFG